MRTGRYAKTRYAAQIRRTDRAALLTRTVTDTQVPLFDTAIEAYESLTSAPANYPEILAADWASYIAMGEIEVWAIKIDVYGIRRATYIPASRQPRNATISA